MTELIQLTTSVLAQAPGLLEHPVVAGTVTSFINFLASRVFANSKATSKKLERIKNSQADQNDITDIKANLEFVLENNEELHQELRDQLMELQQTINKAGLSITKNNTIQITGNGNKTYQNIQNSTITDNSVKRNHNEIGDLIGRNIIIK